MQKYTAEKDASDSVLLETCKRITEQECTLTWLEYADLDSVTPGENVLAIIINRSKTDGHVRINDANQQKDMVGAESKGFVIVPWEKRLHFICYGKHTIGAVKKKTST